MQKNRAPIHKNRGFTLIELMLVLAIGGVLTAHEINSNIREQRKTDVKAIAEHVYNFQRDSLSYYRVVGSWPANATTLMTGGFIDTVEDYYGTPYSVSINTAKNEYTVDFDTKEKDYPFMMSTLLPNVVVTGTSIKTTIRAPGEEVSNEALYPRDGSRPLTGDMDADGNSITDVNEIGVERVYSQSNPEFDVQPSGNSNLEHLNLGTLKMTGTIDANGNSITKANAIGVERVYSQSNPTYDVRPSGTSNLNHLNVNSLKIVGNATVGGSCTTKSIGTTTTGAFVTCQSSKWKTPGNELPVGSIYIAVTTTNPSSTLGYGTWVEFSAGHVLVGQKTSDSSFDRIFETGGSKTQRLIVNHMPSHNHELTVSDNGWPNGSGDRTNNNYWMDEARSKDETGDHLTTSTGGNSPFSLLQPYVVVKMWRRMN